MSYRRRCVVLGGLALALTGCASFQTKPIVPHEVLATLQAVRLDALRSPEPSPPPPPGGHPVLDLAAGMSIDEAVAVGLVLNPELRAFRRERGVAEGELIAAGLWPNPELGVGWQFIQGLTNSFLTSGFEIGINWAPPRPGERGAKTARAQARIEEVRAQIASEEWRLAAEVRKAYVSVLAARRRQDLVGASLELQRRARTVLRERLRQGDASRLEANLLELDLADRMREQAAIANEYERAQQELNRLLGLPPRLPVAVQATAAVLGVRPFALEPSALEATMIDHRPDLVAARQEYEQDERSLQLAYIQRIPWFTFGPMYQRDGEPGSGNFNRFGIGFTFDLPLANLNQGEIARLEAVRDKRRDGFVAKVHLARAEVSDALRSLRAQQRNVRLYDDTIRPAVDENTALTDAAVRLGDVNVLQFVAAQDKVLRFQRDFVETQREYWLAVFDLERAIGARLDDVAGKEE